MAVSGDIIGHCQKTNGRTKMNYVPANRGERPVLITGCSSGIGLASAKVLKDIGYRVIASARKGKDIEHLKAQGFECVQLDLDDSMSIQSAVKKVVHMTEGKLYALFNNGAYGQMGAVEDVSRGLLRAQFETNVFGTHELTRLVIPIMRKQGYGRIIQNSSVLGYIVLKHRGAYNASKFALEGLSDTLRLELMGTGIYVSLIEPGPIISRFRENSYNMFVKNIDMENSVYSEVYKKIAKRLSTEGPVSKFTLPPEAVVKMVIHALESKNPKPRYSVTFTSHLFRNLKRVLSTRMMDRVLGKVD